MGSFIYCILYGYRFKTGQEKELRDAQRCLSEFVEAARVGSHIVDVMPLLNYLPKPLAPWKRKAEELYDLEANLHIANLRKGLENPGWNFSKSMNASKEAEDMSEVELAYDLGIVSVPPQWNAEPKADRTFTARQCRTGHNSNNTRLVCGRLAHSRQLVGGQSAENFG